jgi:putative sigma-54 modulation protein
MEINIRAKNIELTPHLKYYAQKKLFAASRFIPSILEQEKHDKEQVGKEVARVVLEVELEKVTGEEKGRIFRAEAQMLIPGKTFKAEYTAENIKAAIDKVKNELEREVKKYRETRETKKRKGGWMAKILRRENR